MHETYTTPAITLRARAHKEDSVEAVCFTEALGKIRIAAQAAKRPGATFAAAVETGSYGVFSLIRGSYTWRLTGAHNIVLYPFTLDVPKRDAYLRVLSLLHRLLPEHEAHPKLFALVQNFLTEEIEDIAHGEAKLAFAILAALGYADEASEPQTTRELIQEVNRGIFAAGL